MKRKLGRRKFLAVSTAAVAAPAARGPAQPASSASSGPFPEAESRLLEAIALTLLAPGPGQPTPAEAEVPAYLARQYPSGSPRRRRLGRALAALEQESRLRFRSSFADLDPERRTALMGELAGGKTRAPGWGSTGSARFFREIRRHVVDGYYSNPRVFEAIGFGGPAQFIGYPEYHDWPVVEPEPGK